MTSEPEPVAVAEPFQLNLVVADLERSVEFYRQLGWRPKVTGPHASVNFENGFTVDFDQQDFAEQWNSGAPHQSPGSVVLNVGMDSRAAVDDTWRRLLVDGYEARQRPYDAFWGSRFAIVADPDGYQVGLMSPTDPAFRSWPPAPAPG